MKELVHISNKQAAAQQKQPQEEQEAKMWNRSNRQQQKES
jgi:hypothetical protein